MSDFDYWDPSEPYTPTPGETGGSVLGVDGDRVLTYEPTTRCFILAAQTKRFAAVHPPRCDLPFALNLKVLDGNWSSLSPDGRTVALPGAGGTPALIPLDELFGDGTPRPVTNLGHDVSQLRWRGGSEVVALEADGHGRLAVCTVATVTCSATDAPMRNDLDRTQLVVRLG
ncbi:hypothetical protein ABNF97_27705 [Plantactinospora sp. B6F1]|uniref:hypothetical protein n=1 Tax=Plantactinospora sp. B6F1 TaxID=3158971 RepID=UPI0032D9A3BC